MSDDRLTPYLKRVLAVIQEHTNGIDVDAKEGEPDAGLVARIASIMGDREEVVRSAILGLRASDCLIEDRAEFPGIEDVTFWRVHPQCRN